MNNLVSDMIQPKKYSFKIGLYFGSYNPIHIGHLAIANYMVEYTDIDQLWFVVSPQNPFKKKANLLADYHRLEMVERAIDDDERFRASNIEFNLPKPSYTIDTLTYLQERHPNHIFKILMGADNLTSFPKWKNFEMIIENYGVIVYPRPGYEKPENLNFRNIEYADNTPLMEISSSFIRQAIREGKNVRHFMPPKAWKYLDEMNFYK
jgi:nicotinate-nucleotide adenylyltransferase